MDYEKIKNNQKKNAIYTDAKSCTENINLHSCENSGYESLQKKLNVPLER